MSIRSETLDDASRFSLRTSLFEAAPPPPPPPAPAPQPQRQFSAPAPSQSASPSFTFNSLGKHSTKQQQQKQTEQRQQNVQNVALAINRISEQQRQRAATQHMPVIAANTSRTLQPGYLSGGSARTDQTAEIMRLTASLENAQSKLTNSVDRLSKTESMLVRANRALTSERATSNARQLKLQNLLKESQQNEVKLREVVATHVRHKDRPTLAFEESVKKAEELDLQLHTLQTNVESLTAERDELVKRVGSAFAEAEAERKKHAAVVDAVNADVVAATTAATAATAAAAAADAAATAAAVELEHTRVDAAAAAAAADAAAAAAAAELERTRADAEKHNSKIEELRKQLELEASKQTAKLVLPNPEIFSGCMDYHDYNEFDDEQPPVPPGGFDDDDRFFILNPNLPRPKPFSDDEIDSEVESELEQEQQPPLLEEWPEPGWTLPPLNPPYAHSVATRLNALLSRDAQRFAAAHVNPMSRLGVTRAAVGAQQQTMPPDVAALVAAVSNDISIAVITERRAYLTAAGLAPDKIEEDLGSFE